MGRKPSRETILTQNIKYEPSKAGAPDHLDALGVELWDVLAPLLRKNGLLTVADEPALGLLCQTYSDYRAVTKQLRAEGHTVETGSGSIKPHPAANLQKSLADLFSKLCAQFGLTPASRSQVLARDDSEQLDDLQTFINKGVG